MKYKMKTLFWLRKNKLNANNEAAIYCRITVNGKRANDFTTGVMITPQNWDSKKQRIRNDDTKQSTLQTMRQKLLSIHLDLEMKDFPVTAGLVKNLYTKKESLFCKSTVKELFLEYIQDHKKKRAPGTIKNYEVRYNLLYSFLTSENKTNISPEEFNSNFIKQYFGWLNAKGESRNYSIRAIEICHSVLEYALENGKIKSNPLVPHKLKKDPAKKIVWLSPPEIESLESHNFVVSPLQKTADLFLFQCYTGLDYSDLMSVDTTNVQMFQGDKYIIKDRLKTEAIIPYTAKIDALWKKYNYELPKMANQVYNRFLKEVAAILKIDKHLTTHVGRKTFTMNMLNHEGYSMEATSKMAGHSSVRTTETHYAKVNIMLIKNETLRLNAA